MRHPALAAAPAVVARPRRVAVPRPAAALRLVARPLQVARLPDSRRTRDIRLQLIRGPAMKKPTHHERAFFVLCTVMGVARAAHVSPRARCLDPCGSTVRWAQVGLLEGSCASGHLRAQHDLADHPTLLELP